MGKTREQYEQEIIDIAKVNGYIGVFQLTESSAVACAAERLKNSGRVIFETLEFPRYRLSLPKESPDAK